MKTSTAIGLSMFFLGALLFGIGYGQLTKPEPVPSEADIYVNPVDLSKEAQKPATNGKWQEFSDATLYDKAWRYIRMDGRIIAHVVKYSHNDYWNVYLDGAGYGEFSDFESAKKQAEKIISTVEVK